MRQKKTDNIDPISELPDIQDNWLKFARLLAEGKTNSDAYREAISDKSENHILWANASRLANDERVKAWVKAFKREVFNRELYTVEAHVKELEMIQQLALENGNYGAAFQCTQAKGKVQGMYVDKVEDVTPKKDTDDINELLGKVINKHISSGNEVKH